MLLGNATRKLLNRHTVLAAALMFLLSASAPRADTSFTGTVVTLNPGSNCGHIILNTGGNLVVPNVNWYNTNAVWQKAAQAARLGMTLTFYTSNDPYVQNNGGSSAPVNWACGNGDFPLPAAVVETGVADAAAPANPFAYTEGSGTVQVSNVLSDCTRVRLSDGTTWAYPPVGFGNAFNNVTAIFSGQARGSSLGVYTANDPEMVGKVEPAPQAIPCGGHNYPLAITAYGG